MRISSTKLAALGKKTISQAVNRATLTPTPAIGTTPQMLCGGDTIIQRLALASGAQCWLDYLNSITETFSVIIFPHTKVRDLLLGPGCRGIAVTGVKGTVPELV